MIARPTFSIDTREWSEIAISILCITLALTLSTAGIAVKPGQFAFLMGVFTLTVGSGFVLHELAHKFVAIKYGAHARYQTWTFGLFLMLGIAIIPQIFGMHFPLFLAPGAVMIYASSITRAQNGIISVAGPVTNILLALAFFIGGIALFGAVAFADVGEVGEAGSVLATIFLLGARVNVFLAMFNLIPIPPLDGYKVLSWDWRIWLVLFGITFLGSGLITF